ncbi:MAG: hypothetical protein U1F57_01075 [bacterium]
MTPPIPVSSNYSDEVCTFESGDFLATAVKEPLCSDVTKQCYATPSDYAAGMKNFQFMAQISRATRSVLGSIPQGLSKPKEKDGITRMWDSFGDSAGSWWDEGSGASKIYKAPAIGLGAVGLGVLTLVAGVFSIGGCGGTTDTDNTEPEIPPPSNPPSGTDSVCEDVKSRLEGVSPDASLKSLVDGITLPTLDFTYEGTPIWNDSKGNPITTPVKIGKPVSWAKQGDKLFVLTANPLENGAFAPATVLVYKVNADNSLTPVTTTDILKTSDKKASNALNLGFYNPTSMGPMTDGTLGILFGAPNVGIVSTVDPVGLTIAEGDWCSTHSYGGGTGGNGGAGGAGGSDAGVGGSGGK